MIFLNLEFGGGVDLKIITEIKTRANIPTLLFYEESSENNPLVMIIHGFGNDKFEGTQIALKLSMKGFSVLTMDIDKHGERYDGFLEKIDSDASFGKALFNVLVNTCDDIDLLLREIKSHKSVDTKKFGLIGISHGANICNYYISKNDIESCVSILGTPNFVDQIVYSMEKESVNDFESAEEKEILEFVTKLNPYEKLKTQQTSLLMINALKDDDVPYKFSEALFIECAEERDINFILEDEFHFVSDRMIDKAVEWTISKMI